MSSQITVKRLLADMPMKEVHLWQSKHIPSFPPKKCPVFQYHTLFYVRDNGTRYILEKQICLPNWKFKKKFLSGKGLKEFIDWTIESLEHEDLHQVVHEQIGFEVSELLD
jgi:hypothetical protein